MYTTLFLCFNKTQSYLFPEKLTNNSLKMYKNDVYYLNEKISKMKKKGYYALTILNEKSISLK